MRDMSERQFKEAIARNGIAPAGFLGYYNVGHGHSVSVYNTGATRRERLSWLLKQKERADREQEES